MVNDRVVPPGDTPWSHGDAVTVVPPSEMLVPGSRTSASEGVESAAIIIAAETIFRVLVRVMC
jgi:hypothetical protein